MASVYDNLKDVKIIRKTKAVKVSYSGFFIGGTSKEEETEDENKTNYWVAVYHNIHKKWIVTDDLNNAGLNDDAKNIVVVGHSDTLDGIMFVVWEHQKQLGLESTILDEIRKAKKKQTIKVNSKEWDWAKTKKENSLKYQKNTISLNGFTFSGNLLSDCTFDVKLDNDLIEGSD